MRILGWILVVLALLGSGLVYGAARIVGHLGGTTGTFSGGEHEVSSPTRAVLLSMGTISFGGHAFVERHARDVQVTVRVRPVAGDTAPPFVGYGSATDLARYLAPGEFDVVQDVHFSPWSLGLVRVPALGTVPAGGSLPDGVGKLVPGIAGLLDERATTTGGAAPAGMRPLAAGAPLPLPDRQSIWALRPTGAGTTRTLRVPLREGSWAIAMVSPTGRPGVRALVTGSVKVPFVAEVAHDLRVAAGILLAIAVGLLALLLLPRFLRRTPDAPPGIPGGPLPPGPPTP